MSDTENENQVFATISMAEILLAQNMLLETRKVVRELLKSDPDNPRIIALFERLEEVERGELPRPVALPEKGSDHVALFQDNRAIRISFEITEKGMAIAKRTARYMGRPIVRVFTASPGPRGVRTATRDIDVSVGAAAVNLFGMQRPAVHVAAVGYLANTGTFVAMSRTETPLVVS